MTPTEGQGHESRISQRRTEAIAVEKPVRLRWFPARNRAVVDDLTLHGRAWIAAVLQLSVTIILSLPPVVRATGVNSRRFFFIWVVFAIWSTVIDRVLHRRAATNLAAFYVLVVGSLVFGAFVALSLPVLAGTPQTPLWVSYTLMACFLGGSEYEPSLVIGLFIPIAPLATIPIFLAAGNSPLWSILGPVLAGVGGGIGYWFLTRRRDIWRQERHRREMAFAEQRLADAERERDRLGRDLHDSVGTALSLVALYASIAEHQHDSPVESRRFAGSIREAARAALHELRGVIHALPQAPTTVGELAASLAMAAQRFADPAGAAMTLEVETGAAVVVAGGLRTAIVRVFQEAVHNSIHHGRARRIRAILSADSSRVVLTVEDDGCGFEPSVSTAGAGSGLAGMRQRAVEHGGELAIVSARGAGTRLNLALPLSPERPS